MAKLQFPDPAVSDIYTDAGITWTWNPSLLVWSTDAVNSDEDLTAGVSSIKGGTGITVDQPRGNVTVNNDGVTKIVAGSGITINQSNGDVTVTAVPTSVEPTVLNYKYPGGVERLIQDRLEEYVSVKDFGAVGDGVVDDAAAIQTCINTVELTGGTVYFPAGTYKVSSTLSYSRTGKSLTPDSDPSRVNFKGAGKGNTVIKGMTSSMTVMRITGDASGTGGAHLYNTVSDLCFVATGGTGRSCVGLELQDCAYMSVKECTFHNLDTGIFLNGTLSSDFAGLIFNESKNGVVADRGGFSAAHANAFTGCEFRFCTQNGYNGFYGTSNAAFFGCQFEGCGTVGDQATGACIFRLNCYAGEVGPSFYSCYFEVNAGGYDVYANGDHPTYRAMMNFYSCNFNRVGNDRIVTNNIKGSGRLHINVYGCTFTGYGGYVADSSRMYINEGEGSTLLCSGTTFMESKETPRRGLGTSFAGKVDYLTNNRVDALVPNNWTVERVSKGVFRINHYLKSTNYSIVVTSNSGQAYHIQRAAIGKNAADVVCVDVDDAFVDDDFSFIIQLV